MENPIQYCNTDNQSQMGGGVSHNKGGICHNNLSLWLTLPPWANQNRKAIVVCPQGIPQWGEGLMKTLHRKQIY